jgi:AAA+ ATPase superfamily predicted ATPase
MKKKKLDYKQYVTFINREKELRELKNFVNIEPFEILFIHGPKSSGKTTLLYKFFDQIEKEQEIDVKFLNLRKKLKGNYKDFIRFFFGIDYSRSKEDVKEKREYSLFNFFKLSVEVLKGMESGELDPFEIMEKEFLKLNQKGIKPVIIIDELQAIDHIYMNDQKDRQVIIELFNFFVAMTKESNLAHIIIASSDGYFLNTLYTDSRLKQTSKFYKIDYLKKEDVIDWLMNLEKYSKITKYSLSEDDAEKIWDTVGGSMWEIHDILGDLFEKPIDTVLNLYKRKMRGIIAHFTRFDKKKRDLLMYINENGNLKDGDFSLDSIGLNGQEIDIILRDMVRNNILYFDPTEATYFPQSKSYEWGIKLYFEKSDTN